MRTRSKVALGGSVVVVAVGLGGVAVAQGGDEVETGSHDLTSQERAAVERAALEATGGGTVNEVERDDEDGATFEAEVTKPDGSTVDVRLDEQYAVVVIEGDTEDADGDGD